MCACGAAQREGHGAAPGPARGGSCAFVLNTQCQAYVGQSHKRAGGGAAPGPARGAQVGRCSSFSLCSWCQVYLGHLHKQAAAKRAAGGAAPRAARGAQVAWWLTSTTAPHACYEESVYL
jgi:hypothetical protein